MRGGRRGASKFQEFENARPSPDYLKIKILFAAIRDGIPAPHKYVILAIEPHVIADVAHQRASATRLTTHKTFILAWNNGNERYACARLRCNGQLVILAREKRVGRKVPARKTPHFACFPHILSVLTSD